jgi:hypothetical protein
LGLATEVTLPVDRLSIDLVSLDVASQLAGQIGHGGKDAAGDDLPFDFREPEFDMVDHTIDGHTCLDVSRTSNVYSATGH